MSTTATQLFSVININKPQGYTSHDVVSVLRKVFNLKKVGHLGTLDPMATGVLPVCLGKSTRLIEYFPDDKRYEAHITVGITTTTLDAEGDIIDRKQASGLGEAAVKSLLAKFTGTFNQQVPIHSAVHVDGKKLYKYAQQGQDVDLPTREVTIHEIEFLGIDNADSEHPVFKINVHCASGTYIRALARDLGSELGYGAHLSLLTRTAHGKFSLEEAVSLDELKDCDSPHQYLQNPSEYLSLPIVNIQESAQKDLLCNGMKIAYDNPEKLKGNQLCLLHHQNQPLAVAKYEFQGQQLKPIKVFQ